MAKRESLRAYQDEILQKMEVARTIDAGLVQLLFGFRAMKTNFLVSGKDVSELASTSVLEPIPISKPWAAGAANVKGSVYSVTDFSALMGGEPIKRGKFVLLSQDVMPGSVLLIEGLTGLFQFKDMETVTNDPRMKTMPSWVTSCHEIAGERHYLIDAVAMASDPRFSKLQQSGENS